MIECMTFYQMVKPIAKKSLLKSLDSKKKESHILDYKPESFNCFEMTELPHTQERMERCKTLVSRTFNRDRYYMRRDLLE